MKIARNEWMEKDLLDRFCRYVKIDTTSDQDATAKPSTARQWDLLNLLVDELKSLGVQDIHTNPHGYVWGTFPASQGYESKTPIALLAHVDTASDAPGNNVKPVVHENYAGGPLRLPAGLVLDPSDNPLLERYKGSTIITSDGSTLLGADDKSGIAEILTAIGWLKDHPDLPRPPLELVFTSDEEVGRGTEGLPLEALKSKAAYTLDGNDEGSVEWECYDARHARVTCHGRSFHPGTARGRMVNAITMAAQFVALLPRSESPEATDGRYGCLWANAFDGTIEKTVIDVRIRDFERSESDRRVASLHAYAAAVEAAFPGGRVEIEDSVQYRNMKEELVRHPLVVERLKEAVRRTGLEPWDHSIRGGTDGARLTEKGLPTPNLFTGGMNSHSRTEWIPLAAMVRASQTVVELAGLWATGAAP